MPVPPSSSVPYNLKPKDTRLPAGHDDSLDPAEPPTDAETRGKEPFDWAAVDTSKGSTGPADAPLAPPAVDAGVRSVPASSWPVNLPEFIPGRPVHLAIPVPDLDPDIAMWREVTVSIWPFTGAPTEGEWPKGWLGIDNTSTLYICTVGGEPGTWVQVGAGNIPGGGDGMPIADDMGITTATQTPDPIAGANAQLRVVFPADASVMAWALDGDAFARVVFGADPTADGLVMFGDGTFDPTVGEGPAITTQIDNRGYVPDISASVLGAGAILGRTTMYGSAGPVSGALPTIQGQLGDILVGTAGGHPAVFRGTGTGVDWVLSCVVAATDPITAAYVPPNAGALWQDTSGSGSVWMSTGTGSGDWEQLAGPFNWANLTLVNGWSTGLLGGVAQYAKVNGVVHLEMTIESGSAITVATLPAGFLPANTENFIVLVTNSGTDAAGILNITTGGVITVENFTGSVPSIVSCSVSFPT